jgi:hypothetical protein
MNEIEALLKRKQEIDLLKKDQFVETQRWLVEAVELLLRIQNQKKSEITRLD